MKLTVLGFSEAALTMLLDLLEENEVRPRIEVVNNLLLEASKPYARPGFTVELVSELGLYEDLVLGAATTSARQALREAFKAVPTDGFGAKIARSSSVSSATQVGKGVFINPGCRIAGHTVISDFALVNRGALVGHHTRIGEFTTLGPGANIAGNVLIGRGCQIGMGANVLDGLTVGEGSVIGAGSVVTKDIPAGVVAWGNPCKPMRPVG